MELRSDSLESNASGSLDGGLRRQARVRCLTEEEKQKIQNFQKPEDMDYNERSANWLHLTGGSNPIPDPYHPES